MSFHRPSLRFIFAPMKHLEEISLYEAIRQMRMMSAEGQPFSFAHFTYDDHRRRSDGLRVVNRATLRPAATTEEVRNANFKLFYTDIDARAPRTAWQPLLAYFNGKRVKIYSHADYQR